MEDADTGGRRLGGLSGRRMRTSGAAFLTRGRYQVRACEARNEATMFYEYRAFSVRRPLGSLPSRHVAMLLLAVNTTAFARSYYLTPPSLSHRFHNHSRSTRLGESCSPADRLGGTLFFDPTAARSMVIGQPIYVAPTPPYIDISNAQDIK